MNNINIGDIVGDYIILERLEDKNKHQRYRVKCNNCNEICIKYKHHLIKYNKCQHLNFNKKYGKLQIIETTEQRKNKNMVYKCLCDCGKICFKTTDELTNKRSSKSCGCDKNEKGTKRAVKLEKYYKESTFLPALTQKVRVHSTNVKGVYYDNKTHKYCAKIYLKGKAIWLGRYNSLSQAEQIRKFAEDIYFEPIINKYKNQKDK